MGFSAVFSATLWSLLASVVEPRVLFGTWVGVAYACTFSQEAVPINLTIAYFVVLSGSYLLKVHSALLKETYHQ